MVEVSIKYHAKDRPHKLRLTDRAWWLLLQQIEVGVPAPDATLDEVKRWHVDRARRFHASERAAMDALGVTRNYGWRMDKRTEAQ